MRNKTNNRSKLRLTTLAIAASFGAAGFATLPACDDGPAEDAGEKIDEAAEEIADEVDDAIDG